MLRSKNSIFSCDVISVFDNSKVWASIESTDNLKMNIYVYNMSLTNYILSETKKHNGRTWVHLEYVEIEPFKLPDAYKVKVIKVQTLLNKVNHDQNSVTCLIWACVVCTFYLILQAAVARAEEAAAVRYLIDRML